MVTGGNYSYYDDSIVYRIAKLLCYTPKTNVKLYLK